MKIDSVIFKNLFSVIEMEKKIKISQKFSRLAIEKCSQLDDTTPVFYFTL